MLASQSEAGAEGQLCICGKAGLVDFMWRMVSIVSHAVCILPINGEVQMPELWISRVGKMKGCGCVAQQDKSCVKKHILPSRLLAVQSWLNPVDGIYTN